MAVEPDPAVTGAVFEAVHQALRQARRRPLVLGLCGAQGSGKSTLAAALARRCGEEGIAAAALSIDDLYLTRAERQRLAELVHPLLRTRGPPGTHDVALGLDVIAALEAGLPAPLPSFDKARDDRAPASEWERAPAQCDVLVLEGWCVGARPQAAEALREPVNAIEAGEDPRGIWRGYVNDALAGVYQRLFARIDLLVLLAAPSFAVVFDWRMQQEDDLRLVVGPGAPGVMDAPAVARFIQHYERLTGHILAEMPGRADLVIWLAADRKPTAIEPRE
jgi:D-glycerate 3-kinase